MSASTTLATMAVIAARWSIPEEYSYENLDPSRPLVESRTLADWPALQLLALRRMEARLDLEAAGSTAGSPVLDTAAWQLAAGSDRHARRTAQTFLASSPRPSADDRLACGHVLGIALDDGANGSGFDVYLELWKGDVPPDHRLRFELGVSLAADVIALDAGKALGVLEGVKPLLPNASAASFALETAMFHLLVGVALRQSNASESGAAIVRAHDIFVAAGDHVGMAQCALAEYQREAVTGNRAEAMLAYLEYAIRHYEMGCRFTWAASTARFAMALLVDRLDADASSIVPILDRAAELAHRGRSFAVAESVRRFAHRFGLHARDVDGSWRFEPV